VNRTEARFATKSKGQVAFLLWQNVLPDTLETSFNEFLFLYFSQHDYEDLMRGYWSGDNVPACELGECIRIVDCIIRGGSVDKRYIRGELSGLTDYKEWYTRQVTMEDLMQLDKDIVTNLEGLEKLWPK